MSKNMKAALNKSVSDERKNITERFAKADSILGAENNEEEKKVRSKVIRDSFTFPENDYALFDKIKLDCMKAGVMANKSEIVRAGLNALSSMDSTDLKQLIESIEKVKPGRKK